MKFCEGFAKFMEVPILELIQAALLNLEENQSLNKQIR